MEEKHEKVIKDVAASVRRITGKDPRFMHHTEYDRRIIVSMDFVIWKK